MAIELPFRNDRLAHSIRFAGRTYSTGESMKMINYETSGTFISDCGISDMNDYTPNMAEYHDISKFVINGSTGIGTTNTFGYMLAVNGTIGAKEIKVETTSAWPDYVFSDNYNLRPIGEVENYIKEKLLIIEKLSYLNLICKRFHKSN